jgi:hypothetical protein
MAAAMAMFRATGLWEAKVPQIARQMFCFKDQRFLPRVRPGATKRWGFIWRGDGSAEHYIYWLVLEMLSYLSVHPLSLTLCITWTLLDLILHSPSHTSILRGGNLAHPCSSSANAALSEQVLQGREGLRDRREIECQFMYVRKGMCGVLYEILHGNGRGFESFLTPPFLINRQISVR